ncbi:mariner Mos1 transposase [Trichonephila clavipes]|nr:mariner Mos1 transposase [Trichonephila clavipes]
MPAYEPNSRHLREVLIFCFDMKNSATEAHRMLSNIYGEAAISENRAESGFNASRTVILNLKTSMAVEERRFSKMQNWRHYLIKTRVKPNKNCQDHWEQRRKGFLLRIATRDEKWFRYVNPKRRKSWGYPGYASTSTAKPNIHGSKVMLSIGWDQLGVVYYELLKPTETITGDGYRTQLMRLSRALKDKVPQYNERHDKVILQHDNARPHVAKMVNTYLETLKWEVLPQPLYSPDLAPSDYPSFRSIAHGLADEHFWSYEEVKKLDRFVDRFKR